jgi:hypothetical protein
MAHSSLSLSWAVELPSAQTRLSTSASTTTPWFAQPDGRAARLAYYEARKLNNPPTSLLDYNDAKRDLETPAERRTREQRDKPPPR